MTVQRTCLRNIPVGSPPGNPRSTGMVRNVWRLSRFVLPALQVLQDFFLRLVDDFTGLNNRFLALDQGCFEAAGPIGRHSEFHVSCNLDLQTVAHGFQPFLFPFPCLTGLLHLFDLRGYAGRIIPAGREQELASQEECETDDVFRVSQGLTFIWEPP